MATDKVKVKLVNPTRARRVVHDGIEGSQKAITIEPDGGSVDDVEISKALHDELTEREEFEPGSDLKIEAATGSTKRRRMPASAAAPEDRAAQARALLAEKDDVSAAEFRTRAREVIGEQAWPGDRTSKADLVEQLEKM